MVSWMSKELDAAWDEVSPWLSAVVCEARGDMEGHVVVQLECGDEYLCQIDCGDCRGEEDAEINRRFVEGFCRFAEDEASEWLGEVADTFRRTLVADGRKCA